MTLQRLAILTGDHLLNAFEISRQIIQHAGQHFLVGGLTLIPLVQHFASYNGETDISQTAMRLIALQPFAQDYWAKLDIKAPHNWENATWPATAEIQIGYNFNPTVAVYGDLLFGLGADRPYDNGFGLGLRLKY